MKIKHLLLLSFCIYNLRVEAQFAANAFQNKIDFASGTSCQSVSAGDFNLDGKQDIVSANLGASTLTVFVNNTGVGVVNSATYATSFNLSTLSASPSITTVCDLDGDNKPEIILAYAGSSNTYFSIYKNNYNGVSLTSGSFSRSDYLSTGTQPNTVNAEDLDGDGKKDVVFTNAGSGTISVFRNTSSAGSVSFALGQTYSVGSTPGSIALEDLDNDGKRDITVANWGSNTISIYRSTSTLGNLSFTGPTSLSTPTNPNYLKVADFDKDNYKDIVVSNWNAGSLSFFRNISTGSTISMATRFDIALNGTTSYTQGVWAGDLDDDQLQDVMVNVTGFNQLALFKNIHVSGALSTGSFSSRTNFTTTNPVGIIAVDIDNDLRPDLVNSNYAPANISVWKNNMLAAEPTLQTSNLSSSAGSSSITLSFNKGNGAKRLVLARLGSAVNANPADTAFYTASAIFGAGSQIGTGNYVVYADTGSSVTISGLSMGSNYYFAVYEFNGRGGFSNYLTTSPLSGNRSLGDVFYNKSSGNLNLTSSWGSNPDGSGTAPASFNLSNTTFIAKNNVSPSLGGNWFVTGSNVAVVFGDGINSYNLSILNGETFGVDSFAVMKGITFTIQGGLISNKAFFDTLTTVQYTGTSAQNISPYNYFNLIVSSSAKTLMGNTAVTGSLIMLADINTGAYSLTLGSNANQTGTLNRISGSINGTFTRWFAAGTNTGTSGLFPISSGGIYRPIQIEFTSSPATAGTLTASFIAGDPGLVGLPIYDFSTSPVVYINKTGINGVWRAVSGNGLSGGTYTATLTASGFYGVMVLNELRLVKRNISGSWTTQGTAQTPTGTTAIPVVSRTGLSGFGEFGIGGDISVNPLPVKLLSFTANRTDDAVKIHWSTSQEINSSKFILERKSASQQNFETIAELKAAGNSSVKLDYVYLDVNPLTSAAVYRLKEIDLDGSVSYSNEVFVDKGIENGSIQIYPNPADEYIEVKADQSIKTIVVTDILGNVVLSMEATDKKQFSVSELKPGAYLMEINLQNGNKHISNLIKK